ncbi:prepilin peptidase [Rubrobacter radiotolerans]|uniref:Prepilin peptidase n=1 Tax=Rubrobacter radiotolerans TaxID=42256 RepID=A0AB35T1C8_RUBRA|nr:A24 family peptidase [Rubrobacter radiotolerans]MDX5893545.1 prepilin peptidase [Rubrobacter radiotolerans]
MGTLDRPRAARLFGRTDGEKRHGTGGLSGEADLTGGLLLALLAGLLGLVVGSFLNVVIHRVPRRESVVWPGSRCPECGTAIPARDNVPLLSYLLLRGRCRSCGASIPARYPLVEALTGALFLLVALRFGAELALLPALVLVASLVALAVTDLEHRLLPNAIVGPAALAGLALSTLARPEWWWVYPLSGLAAGAALFLISALRPGGMGMGDVKLAAMLGCFLGPYAFLAVFLGALLGTATSAGLMATGRADRRTKLPFGTFMAAGAVLVLFLGPALWSAYLGLF